MRTSGILLLFVLSVFMLRTPMAEAKVTIVTPEWVAQHATDPAVHVIDVRMDFAGYLTAHVPGAVNMADSLLRGPHAGIPMQFLPNTVLATLFSRAGVTDGQTIVLYSDSANVVGTTMAAYALEKIGYPHTAFLDGGWAAYLGTHPVTTQFPTYVEKPVTIHANPDITADLAQIRKAIGNPAIKIIDCRVSDAYTGNAIVWARNGHIPGAINIDWHQLVASSNPHQLKSVADMQSVFDRYGIKKTDQLMLYCNTGREATLEFVVLHNILDYPHVRLYEGSWMEYSMATDLPVSTGTNP